MSIQRIIKTEDILESQIPYFLSSDSELFQEFLKQYYISQSHPTGLTDIVNNLTNFKNLETYSSEVFYTSTEKNRCYLLEDLTAFDNTIYVNSTEGFPNKYGLLQIDNEIITYLEKTSNSFLNCYRGFSGITEIDDTSDISGLKFTNTKSEEHLSKSTVNNLNLVFYSKLFEKFKAHYFPDFEKREINPKENLELILNRARDFYLSKGSDISFKILFDILYGDDVSVFKPKEFIIKTDTDNTLVTRNILIDPLDSVFQPSQLIGKTIYQILPDESIASASIYNAEFRPIDELNLYELSLDSESFINDFISTKVTSVIEVVEDGIIVDSTIGFPSSGELYAKIRNDDGTNSYVSLSYSEKSINKFLNITDISIENLLQIKENDLLIENNLVKIDLDDDTTINLRLLNLIQEFDFSESYSTRVNDILYVTSFGDDFPSQAEFNSWIYNYSTYHNILSIDNNKITFYDNIKFRKNEEIKLIDVYGESFDSYVVEINSSNEILIDSSYIPQNLVKVKRIVEKSDLNSNESAYVQNTYLDENNNSLVVSSSGLPKNADIYYTNNYSFNLVGNQTELSIFTTTLENEQAAPHYLLSGTKVYLNSNQTGIKSDYYFVKKISSNKISLYQTTSDLCLSLSSDPEKVQRSNPITINSNSYTNIGTITISGYEDATKGFSNQLLLKEFRVQNSLQRNLLRYSEQIYNIGDAYTAFLE